ncbi:MULTISPECIES: N-acetyltransferase [Geomicrobium]|uniref:GNAT superfamily N-acetyltransferase n=1 Tax=Geomicrobium sediminis TaxID=1347788 RepID=A0ABS2PBM9_9BACL|nr:MULTISPECIES: N-acetyltransferase [Geomicrobium]MBM7632485.1 GNAT superfamily N-acetyltransferase [Geomicrobium sediminis]GAJ99654.1 LOW QUALITY PROTEIN: N-acetyltransferase [Geomicrobium sp. JCM 19055]GAK07414.1 N-acetyltransferase [Geomicrobium sp. JCM 19038]
MDVQIEQLRINYKTLEDFKAFREVGIQELSMKEELEQDMIENNSKSPFFGIYIGDRLVARMCLYEIDKAYDLYFSPAQKYLELWKLEVLEPYRNQRFGKALVEHAKSFGYPVKTNARQGSDQFWLNMKFDAVHYDEIRDRGENPYVWYPSNVKAQTLQKDESQ